MRLLKYAKFSKILYFTTTLLNSVQSYSVPHSRLLDPSHEHPSSPSVFVVSRHSKFLLSASSSPPTIYLTDLSLGAAPVLLRPQCSASAVVAADAHPDHETLFILGFADGTAAVIDAKKFFDRDEKGGRTEAALSGTGGEMGSIKGLHGIGTSTKEAWTFNGSAPSTSTAEIGARSSGITAVAFVPGRKAAAVTVGADGMCCVVDFTQSTPEKAVLLRSWHLRRPATSLSIICYAQKPTRSQPNPDTECCEHCLAIGREDGRVLLFDLNATLLGEQIVDADGARIVDVEWSLHTSTGKLSILCATISSTDPQKLRKRHETDSTSAQATSQSSMSDSPDNKLRFEFSTPSRMPGLPPIEKNHPRIDLAGISDTRIGDSAAGRSRLWPRSHSDLLGTLPPNSSANGLSSIRVGSTSSCSPPAVPPRPIPRPGGKYSIRRAQTSPVTASNISFNVSATKSLIRDGRRTGIVVGPRKRPESSTENTNTSDSSKDTHSAERLQPSSSDKAPTPPQHGVLLTRGSSGKSSLSYQTASSQLQSPEASTDIVVDWSTASDRSLAPSMSSIQPKYAVPLVTTTQRNDHRNQLVSSAPLGTGTSESSCSNGSLKLISQRQATSYSPGKLPISPLNPRGPAYVHPIEAKRGRKGHVSLSISSISDGLTNMVSSDSETPIAFDKSLEDHSQETIPSVRIVGPSAETQVHTTSEQTGRVNLSDSAATSNTVTTISTVSSSEGPVIEWPSLKRSPRVQVLSNISSSTNDGPSIAMASGKSYSRSSPSSPEKLQASTISLSKVLKGRDDHHQRSSRAHMSDSIPTLQACTCMNTLDLRLQSYFALMHQELKQEFEAQKAILEELKMDQHEDKLLLLEEIRILKADLARSYRAKGRRKGSRAQKIGEEGRPEIPNGAEGEL